MEHEIPLERSEANIKSLFDAQAKVIKFYCY